MPSYFGRSPDSYAFVIFIIVAAISVVLFLNQIFYLRKMTILPVYTLPLVSFCTCFENVVLALGSSVADNSLTVEFAKAFKSLEIPLLLLSLYEITHRLHEARSVNFFVLRFDEGSQFAKNFGELALWLIRFIATGLLVINIFVFYQFVPPSNDSISAGLGGYMYLAQHYKSLALWLALIPPMVLSFSSLVLSYFIMSYGVNVTIGITTRKRWRLILPCSLAQTVGQILPEFEYVASSNLGQLILLGGVTFLLYLVEEDLRLAGTFADFLHKSNEAFSSGHMPGYSLQSNKSNSKDDETTGDIEMSAKKDLIEYSATVEKEKMSPGPLLHSTSSLFGLRRVVTTKHQMEIEECRSFDTIYSGDLKDEFGNRRD